MARGGDHSEGWKRNKQEIRALIEEREDFVNGQHTLEAMYVDGLQEEDGFGLVGKDMSRFVKDAPFIEYVVYSYDVPIHWVADGAGYTIERPPSKTSAGHRNLCPGYAPVRDPGWMRERQPDGTRRWIRKTT